MPRCRSARASHSVVQMRSGLEKAMIVLVFGLGTVILILKPIFDAVVPRFDIKISVASLPPVGAEVNPHSDHGDTVEEAASPAQPSLLRTNVRLVKVVPVGPDGRVQSRTSGPE